MGPEFGCCALEDDLVEGFEDGGREEDRDVMRKLGAAELVDCVAWREGQPGKRIVGGRGAVVDGCSVWVDVGVPKWAGVDACKGGGVVEEVVVVGLGGEGGEKENGYGCG